MSNFISLLIITGSLLVGGLVGYAWMKTPISGLEFLIFSFALPGFWILTIAIFLNSFTTKRNQTQQSFTNVERNNP